MLQLLFLINKFVIQQIIPTLQNSDNFFLNLKLSDYDKRSSRHFLLCFHAPAWVARHCSYVSVHALLRRKFYYHHHHHCYRALHKIAYQNLRRQYLSQEIMQIINNLKDKNEALKVIDTNEDPSNILSIAKYLKEAFKSRMVLSLVS